MWELYHGGQTRGQAVPLECGTKNGLKGGLSVKFPGVYGLTPLRGPEQGGGLIILLNFYPCHARGNSRFKMQLFIVAQIGVNLLINFTHE